MRAQSVMLGASLSFNRMEILPVINCEDEGCVRERAAASQALLGPACWVHVDIADGGLTDGYTTWRDATTARTLIPPEVKIELHVMVREAELALPGWLSAGINRVIVHPSGITSLEAVKQMCEPYGVSVFLGISPQEARDGLDKDQVACDGFHVLAVNPGRSGQEFMEESLALIKRLREQFPGKPISVDGGVTLEKAEQCARAGAVRCAVSSALWGATDRAALIESFSQIRS